MSRIITESMKGKPCPYGRFLDRPTPNICQEGYCHGCQIYLDWQKRGARGLDLPALPAESGRDLFK